MCIKCGVGNGGLACPDENGVWGGVCFHCGEFTPADFDDYELGYVDWDCPHCGASVHTLDDAATLTCWKCKHQFSWSILDTGNEPS